MRPTSVDPLKFAADLLYPPEVELRDVEAGVASIVATIAARNGLTSDEVEAWLESDDGTARASPS